MPVDGQPHPLLQARERAADEDGQHLAAVAGRGDRVVDAARRRCSTSVGVRGSARRARQRTAVGPTPGDADAQPAAGRADRDVRDRVRVGVTAGRIVSAAHDPPGRSYSTSSTSRPERSPARKSSTGSVRSPPLPVDRTRAPSAISGAPRSPRCPSTPGRRAEVAADGGGPADLGVRDLRGEAAEQSRRTSARQRHHRADPDDVAVDPKLVEPAAVQQQRALRLQPAGGELGHQDRPAREHGDPVAVAEQLRRLLGARSGTIVAAAHGCRFDSTACARRAVPATLRRCRSPRSTSSSRPSRRARYLPDRGLATALFLSLKLEKPLLLEGEAGVGKTEAAKALARALDARLIRLQCYEGLDVAHAVYEWNYPRQLLHIRAAQEGTVDEAGALRPEFLIRRPLLEAIEAEEPVVLLIDEVDRADEEFEAFLLEVLSDFQITMPELGTIVAKRRPLRDPDLEPHARAARRAQAPLPLPLDRPSVARARDRDREAARAGRPGAARRRGGARSSRSCACSTSQKPPGRRRDDRLGAGADRARRAGARRRQRRGDARLGAQVPRGPARRSATRRSPGSSRTRAPCPLSARRPARRHVRPRAARGRARGRARARVATRSGASTPSSCGGRTTSTGRSADARLAARGPRAVRPRVRRVVPRRRRASRVGATKPPPAGGDAPRGGRRPAPGPELDGGDTSLGGWSEEELLRTKDFASMTPEEFARARRLIPAIALARPQRRTRRLRPDSKGDVLDVRGLVRGVARDRRRSGRARVPQPRDRAAQARAAPRRLRVDGGLRAGAAALPARRARLGARRRDVRVRHAADPADAASSATRDPEAALEAAAARVQSTGRAARASARR